jgi:hypothetical protein
MLPQLPEPAKLPELARHPSVLRAAVSPSAAVVTAAGAGIGLLADPHSAVLAVILGAGAWLGRMAVAVFRVRRKRALPAITMDPWAVPEPWRQYVRQALGARQRFDQTIAGWAEGPLRDRLVQIQPQLWQATGEVWSIAQRGAALEGTVRGVVAGGARPSIVQLSTELQQVQAQRQRTAASDRQASLARSEEAIAAQLRAAHRSQEAKAEVLDRLRVLTAQLDEAVTQLLELGLEQAGGAPEGSADEAAGSVDALVEEIVALHQGLREAGAASSGEELPGPAPAHPPALPPSPPPTS